MKKTYIEQLECFTENTLDKNESKELLLTLSGKPELINQLQDNLYMNHMLDDAINGADGCFYADLMEKIGEIEEIQEQPKPAKKPSRSNKRKVQNKKPVRSRSSKSIKYKKENSVKPFVWIGTAIAASVLFAFLIFNKAPESNLVVTSVDGSAELLRNGKTIPLNADTPLYNGDKIFATKGSTILNFKQEASFIEITEDSSLRISYDVQAVNPSKAVTVTSGKALFNIQKQSQDQSLRVITQIATIDVIGTEVSVSASPTASTIEVNKGLVCVTNNLSGDKFDLTANHRTIVESKKFPEIMSTGKDKTPKILSFTALNPELNKPIDKYMRMKSGDSIRISDLSQIGYNIRVNVTNQSSVEIVKVVLTDSKGIVISKMEEAFYPYTMVGDDKEAALKSKYKFESIKAVPGKYTLTSKVFIKGKRKPIDIVEFVYILK